MSDPSTLIYGTCVALGRKAALLAGPSGSGKSDLALRFVLETPPELRPALVSDDQVLARAANGKIIVSAPETISGKLEARGIGIVELPHRREAELAVAIKLAMPEDVPRMPPRIPETMMFCGLRVPVLLLAPFEASAHLKLRLALQSASG